MGTSIHFASATLLNSRWVLTAAHVLVGVPANGVNIYLGVVELDDQNALQYLSSEIRRHPLFNLATFANK